MASSLCDQGFRLLLVGKTGVGKSATGNSILGRREFESKSSTTSTTKSCRAGYAEVDGEEVMVVDGPGLADTDMSNADCLSHVSEETQRMVARCPDGYHAVLIIIALGRLTEEDGRTMKQLEGIFGQGYTCEYGILVVTHGDNYDEDENNGMSFKTWCCTQGVLFQDLRRSCNNRVVLFDNRSKDSQVRAKQRKELFDLVSQMNQNSQRLTSQVFQAAQAARERMMLESREPVITLSIEKEICLIQQNIRNVKCNSSSDLPAMEVNKAKVESLIAQIHTQDKGTGVLSKCISALEDVHQDVAFRISVAKRSAQQELDRAKIQQLEKQTEKHLQELKVLSDKESERRTDKILSYISTGVSLTLSVASGIANITKTGIAIHRAIKAKP